MMNETMDLYLLSFSESPYNIFRFNVWPDAGLPGTLTLDFLHTPVLTLDIAMLR